MKMLLRRLVCWLKGLCWRCYHPLVEVHHHYGSPMWGMKYGWYEKGCGRLACAGWIEPLRRYHS